MLHPTLWHPALLHSSQLCYMYLHPTLILFELTKSFYPTVISSHLISPCLMSAYIGPCGGVPSRLHSKTVHSMMRNLDETRPGFDVMHEFSGKQHLSLTSLLPRIRSPPCVYLLSYDNHALLYEIMPCHIMSLILLPLGAAIINNPDSSFYSI